MGQNDIKVISQMPYDVLQKNIWSLFGKVAEPKLARENTGLLCIDLQYDGAHPNAEMASKAEEAGIPGFFEYYWNEISGRVLPNVKRLQEAARRAKIEVIHVRIAAITADGRDTTRRYKAMGLRIPRDAQGAQFLPAVAPVGDELVFSKVTSSAFNSTTIDRVLRNLEIKNLILVGISTNGCVESTARSAAELDYGTIVVSDATASIAPQLHEHALLNMSYRDAAIKTTDEIIDLFERI